MAKEDRPIRTSGKAVPSAPGKEAKADSRQAGDGSSEFYVNDAGEFCIGTKCFALRFKPGEREVRVKIDRNECGADMQPFIDALYQELGQGAPTVYETKSKMAD
jgi:hypothetical protein